MINWNEASFAVCCDSARKQGWVTPGKRDIVTPRELWREYWKAMDAYCIVKRVLKGDFREARPTPPRVPKREKSHEETAPAV